ncbi:MAG TPA: anhydro-N-acetylmuramic acid kinase [Polyangia bacterium]
MAAAHPIVALLGKQKKRVVGLMSGTSVDGIDAALGDIDGFGGDARVTLVDFRTTPYTAAQRREIHALFAGDAAALCQGNFALGAWLADAARAIAGERAIDLVGSHGQTVWHQPPSAGGVASTLQLGEPAVIAARTGVVTVGDFRVADVAHGGEGAPLLPFADWLLFRAPGRVRALQNIGGIANVAVVSDDRDATLAFDNGPGNVMIDALMPAASNGAEAIDRDGAWSARGRVQDDLLAELMRDDYLALPPPKSTGRERYGAPSTLAWAARHADRAPVDLLRTAVAFAARAIADSYRRFVLPRGAVAEVLVSGGGAHNRTLMAALAGELAPIPVAPFFAHGIDADAKEAVAFALFAVQAIHADPANLPSVTGAARAAILGKICLP